MTKELTATVDNVFSSSIFTDVYCFFSAVGSYIFYIHRTKEKKRPSSVASGTTLYSADTGSYLDDSIRVSYINSHIELPKVTSVYMLSCNNEYFT